MIRIFKLEGEEDNVAGYYQAKEVKEQILGDGVTPFHLRSVTILCHHSPFSVDGVIKNQEEVTEETKLMKWVLHNLMDKDYILDSKVSKTS